MGRLRQFHDPELSLWQSAVDQTIVEKTRASATLSVGGVQVPASRPSTDHPVIDATAEFCEAVKAGKLNVSEPLPSDLSKRPAALGAREVALYCSTVAFKLAKALARSLVANDEAEIKRCKQQLGQFGSCDVRYSEAIEKFAEYVASGQSIPYKVNKTPDEFDVTGKLPANARVAVVGDWGTGRQDAQELLGQIARKNPDVVIHLGDVYYSGTKYEIDKYFNAYWRQILELDTHPKRATFTLSGNHDMYSGGAPYYDVIRKLGQPASYFCLKNDDWQFLALDTGKNDCQPIGNPSPTYLEDTEVTWLKDRVQNAGKRKTILLSHHQLFTAYEDIGGKEVNERLLAQVQPVLDKIAMWLWGHEHNLVIYEQYRGVWGRCVGHGAYPVGDDELNMSSPKIGVKPVKLDQGFAFYRHGYVIVDLNGPEAVLSYYQDSDEQVPHYKEKIAAGGAVQELAVAAAAGP